MPCVLETSRTPYQFNISNSIDVQIRHTGTLAICQKLKGLSWFQTYLWLTLFPLLERLGHCQTTSWVRTGTSVLPTSEFLQVATVFMVTLQCVLLKC